MSPLAPTHWQIQAHLLVAAAVSAFEVFLSQAQADSTVPHSLARCHWHWQRHWQSPLALSQAGSATGSASGTGTGTQAGTSATGRLTAATEPEPASETPAVGGAGGDSADCGGFGGLGLGGVGDTGTGNFSGPGPSPASGV